MSEAITRGIRVTVQPEYLPERSSPKRREYVFAYTVKIVNEGVETVQLLSRHWVITDGDGKVQEVKGDGVVGAQPVLHPGQRFEYTSGCSLRTPRGTMEGKYLLTTERHERFDARIAPFDLALPLSLN